MKREQKRTSHESLSGANRRPRAFVILPENYRASGAKWFHLILAAAIETSKRKPKERVL